MKRKHFFLGLIIVIGLVLLEESFGLLKEGSTAPRFTANLSSGSTISLTEFLGKKNVVLFFYPRDFTRGCTAQVCGLRDNYKDLQELDAVIFGVSRDDETSHEKFIEAYDLPFPLISDPGSSLIRAYRVQRLWGLIALPKRVTYVIDKNGMIRLAAHHEVFVQKHLEDVFETLKHLNLEDRRRGEEL